MGHVMYYTVGKVKMRF